MRTFSFFLHTVKSSTPSLMFEISSDEETVKWLARQALAASASSLAVEIREQERLLYSLDRNGVSWPNHRGGVESPAVVIEAVEAVSYASER
jgi:hypothetical protein